MKKDRILAYIRRRIDDGYMRRLAEAKKAAGVTAMEVAEEFGIFRANASALLNQMVKQGQLIKIESRPVYFLPAEALNRHACSPGQAVSSHTPESFLRALGQSATILKKRPPQSAVTSPPPDSPFDLLIGARSSLANQVEQARSAILYPPSGLHTLITGESGTGKTLFARTMHEYGLKTLKKGKKDYAYAEFNCADYYHNPQLLMSQLFGHVKGAFTGAGEETRGIVEKADGGILFLDEIHRLPPEGQELLFYLMDKGHYRKLGESGNMRQASVLIIAATTEDPGNVLLRTFIRRIPLTISLPPFRDKPMAERITLIEHGFKRESSATRKNLIVSPDVVKALACFNFPGNIGQLSSEIKVLCARIFLNGGDSGDDLRVGLDHLAQPIREHYERALHGERRFPSGYRSDIFISPSSDVRYLHSGLFNESSYKHLMRDISACLDKGLGKEELDRALDGQIRAYCSGVLEKFYCRKLNREEMYKVLEPEVVDFTIGVMRDVSRSLDLELSQRSILVMAFHIKYLLERLKSGKTISESEMGQAEKDYCKEMPAARDIVARIRQRFGLVMPKDEIYFIAILLANLNAQNPPVRPALFVVAHGDSTASSIAGVCNQLMDCDLARAVDAPLERSVEDSYQTLLAEVRALNPEKGVILAVDMGSLVNFGERLTRDTGIPVRTLSNVTTLMVLELTRVMLGKEDDLDVICGSWTAQDWGQTRGGTRGEARNQDASGSGGPKRNAIITLCASGAGTSEAFKTMLEEELAAHDLAGIPVIALTFSEVRDKSDKFRSLQSHYNVLACVGNMDCDTGAPFVHVSRLISQSDKERFITFIRGLSSGKDSAEEGEQNLHTRCKRFLEHNVTFINPEVSVKAALAFLEAADPPKVRGNESLQISLVLHISFMLERNILNKKILYDGEEACIAEHAALYARLKEHMYILEDSFDISIHDAEICYIMQTINKS